jgi:vacuolar-type H+-ATPase subunit I/STV1
MFESAWAQNTAEIKNKMKIVEADRKTKTAGADPKVIVQVEKEYKSKMDDLNKQLDIQ